MTALPVADEWVGASSALPPLLDIRPSADFVAGHVPGAASIPLEELAARSHELPPSHEPLRIMDGDATRITAAAEYLARRGRRVLVQTFEAAQLVQTGLSHARLWRPTRFLAESLERIGALDASHAPSGGKSRRAVDVACGAGRDAVHLALQGYLVDAIDILPDALQRVADLAVRNGCHVQTICQDLHRQPTLAAGAYDLIVVVRFLHRPLLAALRRALAPGGWIVYETFHADNRRTGRPPIRADHLVQTGELAGAFAGMHIVVANDAVVCSGRVFSQLLAHNADRVETAVTPPT
jgi:SAM-dependent methyltransferase